MAPNPKTLKAATRTVAATKAVAATRTVAATKAARHQVKPVRATPGASAGGPARVGPAWQPSRRAEFLVDTLGNKLIASLLRVAESQPSRWRRAEEVPSPRVAPILVDLDHIVGRLLLIWDKSVIGDWLTGANAFLDGARPIDVLVSRGSTEVIEAIEAETAGAYA